MYKYWDLGSRLKSRELPFSTGFTVILTQGIG
jgi:hypothetical protein